MSGVLGEIARVSFTSFDWRHELVRSKATAANGQGHVYPVLAKAITALRYAPEWKGVLAFNEFDLMPAIVRATPWGAFPGSSTWTDHEDRLTAEWLQRNGILVDVHTAGQAAQTVARDRSFHPIRSYLESLRWDGVERLDCWLWAHLGVEETTYARAVGARWLISAIARIYRPGVKADCCLILEGPQGTRKSTALKTLAGPYFTDGAGGFRQQGFDAADARRVDHRAFRTRYPQPFRSQSDQSIHEPKHGSVPAAVRQAVD